jgi:hypothetical protein
LHLRVRTHVLDPPLIELYSTIGTPNQPHPYHLDMKVIIVKTEWLNSLNKIIPHKTME